LIQLFLLPQLIFDVANTIIDSAMDDEHRPGTHWSTPQKKRIQSKAEDTVTGSLNTPGGHRITLRATFTKNKIPPSTGYRIAKETSSRRLKNDPERKETRGRKRKITERDLRAVEIVLWTSAYDGRTLSWNHLALESGLDVCGESLRQRMKHMGYRRCIACRRSWISRTNADRRVEWAKNALKERPEPKDWKCVLFSDETHIGYGSPGQIWVTRRPEEVTCPDCVQYEPKPRKKDEKKVHCWGVVGYDYKSELHQYNSDNSNGKMTQKVYIELLEKEYQNWPTNAVLEEDNDSGHGPSVSNPVRKWKAAHNIAFYFNCPLSPDLAPIENAWKAPKASLRKFAHWDEKTVLEVAREGWRALTQETINSWVLSMPERLKMVIKSNGQMTAF
jgi:hypothetical protein